MRFSWARFVTQLPDFILRTLLRGANAVNLGSGPRLGRQLEARGGSALCSAGSEGGGQLCARPRSSPFGKKSTFLVYLCLLEGVVSGCRHFLHIPLESGGRGDFKEQKTKPASWANLALHLFLLPPQPVPGTCCPEHPQHRPWGSPWAFPLTFIRSHREGSHRDRRVWRSPVVR